MKDSKTSRSTECLITEEIEEKLNRWLSSDYELLSSTDGISKIFDEVKLDVGKELEKEKTPFKSGMLPINKSGNRYSNILPRENTRVILENYKEFDLPTDYINANHVKFGGRYTHYIVTQGPTTATIVPFWLMIWEQDVSVLVMLTKRWENGREKCIQYWPDKVPIQTHHLKISLLSEEPLGEYIYKRKFKMVYMENEEEVETKIVQHLFYSEWGDFGIPKDPSTLLKLGELVSKIDKKVSSEEGSQTSVLVHCSAGVGRAGTFVAIHSIMEEILNTKNLEVDIPKTLVTLRRQREGAVQTLEQFAFIYSAVAAGILANFS